MTLPVGTYALGPSDGVLSVRTGRTGAVAKAGHDLLLHVKGWSASVAIGEDPSAMSIALEVDGASLRVIEGTGGMKALDDDDRADIHTTIDAEILMEREVTFRSTEVAPAPDDCLAVTGDLTILGTSRPVAFPLTLADDGTLHAEMVIRQSDWGIKPYSALFGALKVADEVHVAIDARLPAAG
jgi:polyisoprenoid-binding protein YceI